MAPVEVNVDYYAVLEISNSATFEAVTKSYRRLARIRHPDKNRNKAESTAAFQLLQSAYDTIKDPEKRRAYDTRWPGIRDSRRAQQDSDRRQAEAAETEKARTTEERAKQQKEYDARQERLRLFETFKSGYHSDIFDVNQVIRILKADLKRLQDHDDEDLRKERHQNTWWAYLASPIFGKVKETDEQKQARDTERLHRLASKTIKRYELREKQAKLQTLQDALIDVNIKIAGEKKMAEDEAQARARERTLRMEQEARSRAQQEMRERWVQTQKEQAERAAKEAREAQAAREAREARERVQKAAAAEKRRRETEERAQAMRAAEEAARKVRNDRFKPATPLYSSSRASGSTKSTCQHDKFWPKVDGSHLCSNCHALQRRFAFRCPGCGMIACASCRQSLRGKRFDSGRRFGSGGDYDYDADSGRRFGSGGGYDHDVD